MSIIVISVENYAGAGDNIENCAYFAKICSYETYENTPNDHGQRVYQFIGLNHIGASWTEG